MFYKKFKDINELIVDLNLIDDEEIEFKNICNDNTIGISTKKIDDKIVSKFENLFENLNANFIKDKFNVVFGKNCENIEHSHYQPLLETNFATCSVMHDLGYLVDYCCGQFNTRKTSIRYYSNFKKFIIDTKDLINDIRLDENKIDEIFLPVERKLSSSFILYNEMLKMVSKYYVINEVNLNVLKSFLGAYNFNKKQFVENGLYKKYLNYITISTNFYIKRELFENFLDYIDENIKISTRNYRDLIWERYINTIDQHRNLGVYYGLSDMLDNSDEFYLKNTLKYAPSVLITIDMAQIANIVEIYNPDPSPDFKSLMKFRIFKQLEDIREKQFLIKKNILDEIFNSDESLEYKSQKLEKVFNNSILLSKNFLFKNNKAKKSELFSKIKIN